MKQEIPRSASRIKVLNLKVAMSKTRVFLVDDSAAMRNAVRSLFSAHPKFEVVGEAEHGLEAVEKVASLRPDLIVLDMAMPVMNGLQAAPLLIKLLPNVWLILFTLHDSPEVLRMAKKAGIHAVVLKNHGSDLIPQAEAFLAKAA